MSRHYALFLFLVFSIFVSAAAAYAIADGSSNSPDMPSTAGFIKLGEERGRSIVVTAGFDHVFERNLEDNSTADSGEIEGDWFLLGFSYRIKDLYEPYLRLGLATMNSKWSQGETGVMMDSEPDWAIGGGFKMLAYKAKVTSLSDLKVNLDGQVRYTSPSIDNIKISGADRTRNVTAKEFSIFEGRATATASLEISLKNLVFDEDEEDEMLTNILLSPYLGIGYMNSINTLKFDFNGTNYGYDETSQEHNFGAIAGLDILSPDFVTLNLEGQLFGNDKSASGGVNIKF
ncbi:MAG: hypothetical protein ABH843_03990 [Candidatus Omnitrophota bacterium]